MPSAPENYMPFKNQLLQATWLHRGRTPDGEILKYDGARDALHDLDSERPM